MFRILRRIERTLWHDETSFFTWSVHLRFSLSRVPNSLKVLTLSKVCPFTVSDGIYQLVISKLSASAWFSFHLIEDWSLWPTLPCRKCVLPFISFSQAMRFLGLQWSYRVVSSASWKHEQFKSLWRSLTYRLKKKRPNVEPWERQMARPLN